MVTYKTGDIFQEAADAVVNTVNCVGVMGRGIALQFKRKYPDNFKAYAAACERGEVVPGKMFVTETGGLMRPRFIVNFPTKRHWRGKSRLEDIENGLDDLVRVIERLDIKSVAIPPLGCGLGGLDWNMVRSLVSRKLERLDGVDVVVFEPKGAPDAEAMPKNAEAPAMTAGRAALVELIHRYLSGLLDPFITLLEIHKLLYFLQEAEEPLRLKYKKAPYGPYAENLRHVLLAIEGHFITGYADGGDQPYKRISLVPEVVKPAGEFLENKPETKKRFEKVVNLVEGFETSFGLELLSTVHWVVVKEKADGVEQVKTAVYGWDERKKRFTPRQIELAYSILMKKGWIKRGEVA